MTTPRQFWSRFAPRYDGHVLSRDATVLAPRIAATVGSPARVLDAGCGTGQVAVELARVARQVASVDFVHEMLAIARNKTGALGLTNITFQKMTIESLAFPAASFDAVVLSNVLHLVENPQGVLAEIRRVLKPQGKLVAPTYCHAEGLATSLLSRLATLLFGVPVRQRFRVNELLTMVQSAGFELTGCEVVRFKMPLVFVEAIAR